MMRAQFETARPFPDAIDTRDALGLLGVDASPLNAPTAHERRVAAWRAACNRLGFNEVIPSAMSDFRASQYRRFVHAGGGEWMMNRASGVALVLVDPDEGGVTAAYEAGRRYNELGIGYQRRDNETRDQMTRAVCMKIAGTMIDTAYMIADRAASGRSNLFRFAALEDSYPGYTMIRNWLAWDCGARYVLACEVAFNCTERHVGQTTRANSHLPRYMQDHGERGWL